MTQPLLTTQATESAENYPSVFHRYGVAALCATCAVLMRWLLDPVLGPYLPLATIFGFVGIAVWYGGPGPALFTVVVCYLAANWLFFEPGLAFSLSSKALWGLGMYLFSTLVLIAVGDAMRRAQRQARLHAAVVLEGRHQLESEVEVRKRSEEALRDMQMTLLRAQRSAQAGLWEVELPSLKMTWSSAYYELFGLDSTAEPSHRTWISRIHPDDRATADAEFQRSVLQQGPHCFHFRIVRPNGTIRWMQRQGDTMCDQNGQPMRISGITLDITERKEAEKRLNRAIQFDDAVMQSMGEGLYTVDGQGLLTFMNVAAENLFGWTFDELQGRKMHDVTHYQHPDGTPFPAAECAGLQVLNEGKALTNYEDTFIRKDGTFFDVVFSSAALREGNTITGLVVVFRDVTERKRTQEALRQRERFLSTVTDAARVGLVVVEPGYVYRFANEAYAEMFHLSANHIVGRHVYDLLPDGWGQIQPRLDQAFAGQRVSYELTLPSKEGEEQHYFAVSYEPHNERDGQRTVVVVVVDITIRKQAEEARRVSEEELRSFAQHLEELVDERTKELTQSQERLRALTMELNRTEQRERKRVAMELHDHLAQMLALGKMKLSQIRRTPEIAPKSLQLIQDTDDILTRSLTYTRTLVGELAPPVLHDFGLPAGLKWLGEQMIRHDLLVTVSDSGSDIQFREDQTVLLFQSVRELLINVSKHAKSAEANVILRQDNGNFHIDVQDPGVGFDRDSSTPLASQFGLFSIAERMRALGGTFVIKSAPGQGTLATLTLPLPKSRELDKVQQARNHKVEQERQSFSLASGPELHISERIRVLLVDDHAMVRQGLRSMLESYSDIEVIGEAWDGEGAFAEVEALQPSIVVMDINMPKMNGVEATARIKARYSNIIVIGLSVNASADAQVAMSQAGASVLLTKEAAMDDLYVAIKTAWDHSKQDVMQSQPRGVEQ